MPAPSFSLITSTTTIVPSAVLTVNYRDIPVTVETPAGRLVVVGVTNKGSGTISSVSDTSGNTYTVVKSATLGGYAALAYSKISSTLTTSSSIRVTLSGTGQRPMISAAASGGLGLKSVTSTSSTYTAKVTPNTIVSNPNATGGYAVAVIVHPFDYNSSATTAASGSTILSKAEIPVVTGNSSTSTQFSFVWKNLLITSSSSTANKTLGVNVNNASLYHNAAAAVFSVSSAPTSYPQVIELF